MSITGTRARLLSAVHAFKSGVLEAHHVDARLAEFEDAVAAAAGDASGDARAHGSAVQRERIRDLAHQVRAIRADRDAMARARDAAVRQLDEKTTIERLRAVLAELQGGQA